MKDFKLPDLGEGLQEAEVVEWLVKEGDTVEVDQPIVSVETAKAVVEVPSPVSGTVARLHCGEGEIVQVGAVLVSFGDPGSVAPAAEPSAGASAPTPRTPSGRKDKGTVIGALKSSEEIHLEDEESVTGGRETGVRATPAVRALARKLNVDLKVVTPTGSNDTITRADIERVHNILKEVEPMQELRGPRRAMAHVMSNAHQEVVNATIFEDADVHAWPKGTDFTIRMIRAIVEACKVEPALNGWFFPKEMGRRLLKKIHLGIAVDTGEGLFVAVMKDVGSGTPKEWRQGLDRLKKMVRERSIPPEELRGNTITLSNFGTLAGKYGTPIVVPPTVAILGSGRIREEVIAVDGKPEVRRILPLSVSIDHRVITGGEAARWLSVLIEDLRKAE